EIMRYQAMTKQHWQAAAHYIEQAIDLDSGYALAWTWRSMAQRSGVDRGFVPQDSGLREAHRSLERALALDPNLPEAYEQLAQCQRLVEWNFVAANASAQRALALDPGGTDAMAYAAVVALDLGHVDQAIALDERRVALDPADPDARATLGMAYYSAARLDEAAKSLEAIAPEFQSAVGSEYLPQIYLAQGHIKEAASAAEQPGDPVLQQYARALVYYREGRQHAADSVLADFSARYGDVAACQVADVYAYRGDANRAFEWLERAYAQRDEGLVEIKTDPLLRDLHADPRYAALLARMHLPL